MIIVPTQGINSKGQSIQTLNVTGILYAGTDFEAINLSLVESSGKKITSTTGVIELTKINYQPMTSKPSSNLVAKAKTAAATAAAKAKATATTAAAKAKTAAATATAKAKAPAGK